MEDLPYFGPFITALEVNTGIDTSLHIIYAAYKLLCCGCRFGQIRFNGLDLIGNKLRVLALDPACLDCGQQLPGGMYFLQFVISLCQYSRNDLFPLP